MPRGRQTELRKGTEGKIRGIKSSKPTRIRDSDAARYEVLPKIRSVQEGRIRLGSVAPLLSHRAKALAMVPMHF